MAELVEPRPNAVGVEAYMPTVRIPFRGHVKTGGNITVIGCVVDRYTQSLSDLVQGWKFERGVVYRLDGLSVGILDGEYGYGVVASGRHFLLYLPSGFFIRPRYCLVAGPPDIERLAALLWAPLNLLPLPITTSILGAVGQHDNLVPQAP